MSIRGKYLKFLQSLMPPVSRTEQEALDAGTTSAIEGSLYNGSPDWKAIVGGYDPGELTAEENAARDLEEAAWDSEAPQAKSQRT